MRGAQCGRAEQWLGEGGGLRPMRRGEGVRGEEQESSPTEWGRKGLVVSATSDDGSETHTVGRGRIGQCPASRASTASMSGASSGLGTKWVGATAGVSDGAGARA
jgi:hypothetical protein